MPKYANAVVTFIDILGFSGLIEQSSSKHNDPKAVDKILNILAQLKRANDFTGRVTYNDEGEEVVNFTTDNFSDCLIRSTLITDPTDFVDAIGAELMSLASMQAHVTINEGLMIRGGMAAGELYRDEKGEFLFGPVFVEAYRLEKKAVVPRILLSEQIVGELKDRDSSALDFFVQEDKDGSAFVDYLRGAYDTNFGTWPITGIIDCNDMMKAHKTATEKKNEELRTRDIHTRQKSHWMANYHNRVINRIVTERPAMKPHIGNLVIDTAVHCQ
jgi:hypothetical protein